MLSDRLNDKPSAALQHFEWQFTGADHKDKRGQQQ